MPPGESETSPSSAAQDPELDRLLSDFDSYMDSNSNPQPAGPPPTNRTATEENENTGGGGRPGGASDEFFRPYRVTALESLGEMFSNIPKARLEAVLEAHGGSVERAANYLLQEISDTDEGAQRSMTTTTETDEEMARRLDREERRIGDTGGSETMETDEMLARQLAGLNAGGAGGSGAGVGEGDGWRAAVALQRELDNESSSFVQREADEMVRFVRDGLADGVKLEIRERGLNDTQGIREGVEWGVSGVELVGFSVPERGVHVERLGNAVKVAVRDVLMEVRIARWHYKREGWLPLSDSGRAWVVVSGVSARLRIGRGGYVGSSIGKVEGTVKMKTSESAANWLYNAIGVMTKGILGGWIADVVGDALKRAVLERMHLWEISNQEGNEEQVGDPPPSTNPDAG